MPPSSLRVTFLQDFLGSLPLYHENALAPLGLPLLQTPRIPLVLFTHGIGLYHGDQWVRHDVALVAGLVVYCCMKLRIVLYFNMSATQCFHHGVCTANIHMFCLVVVD